MRAITAGLMRARSASRVDPGAEVGAAPISPRTRSTAVAFPAAMPTRVDVTAATGRRAGPSSGAAILLAFRTMEDGASSRTWPFLIGARVPGLDRLSLGRDGPGPPGSLTRESESRAVRLTSRRPACGRSILTSGKRPKPGVSISPTTQWAAMRTTSGAIRVPTHSGPPPCGRPRNIVADRAVRDQRVPIAHRTDAVHGNVVEALGARDTRKRRGSAPPGLPHGLREDRVGAAE